LVNNAEHLRRDLDAMLGTFKEILGEKDMPTMVEIWKAEEKTNTGREMVLTVLRARFMNIPNEVEEAILTISDPTALKSWAAHAATCQTISEFAEALK
jgi:hypothetical protein